MKKKNGFYRSPNSGSQNISEPAVHFRGSAVLKKVTVSKIPQKQLKEFTFREFKKITDKSPFTLSEWADLLCLSERTLQRYAKANSTFSGLHIERILQLEKLLDTGNEFFKNNFNEWLHSTPFPLNGRTPYSLLGSYEGIKTIIDVIGRIQHGITA
jgi:AraC-like DNA-binding protein